MEVINLNVYKQMRKKANLTQQELAEKLGVGRSAVARWEIGAAIPRPKLLGKLSRIFNCTIDDLLQNKKSTEVGA